VRRSDKKSAIAVIPIADAANYGAQQRYATAKTAHEGASMPTTTPYADQRDEFNAGLVAHAPAELVEGFGRLVAEQAAVDYAARAPKLGERAPDFTLADQLGRPVSLVGELEQGPVVLIFYRGEWCPYCNIMLRTYGSCAAEFATRQARMLAVSPQTPDTSLTMAEKHKLAFPVLSDEGGEVIDSYGLRYEVDAQSRQLLEAADVDVAKFNGRGGWILPAPAVFVIDRQGIVRFASVNGDYTQRAEPDEALAALDALHS
jgi:peroxiredoxin